MQPQLDGRMQRPCTLGVKEIKCVRVNIASRLGSGTAALGISEDFDLL